MNREEFIAAYTDVFTQAYTWAEKARREGLLALEELISDDKYKNRDIFSYGMRFVVDGTDSEIINKILSNIITQEEDHYRRVLKTIQKEALLAIQEGWNPRLLVALMNSYTDMSLEEDEAYQALKNE